VPGIADVVWSVIARVDPARDPARVVLASAERRSGNSVLAAATAIALVRHVRVPVCLVETDVEHPALARYLELRSEGLSDVLDGRASLEVCLQSPRDCPGLWVLPGGTPRKPVSGEFAAARMAALLARLGTLGRYVVLDVPSLLDHLESRVLLRHADFALLVLRAGATRTDAATRAHRIMVEAQVPLIGSIFNDYGPARSFSGAAPHRLTEQEILRFRRLPEPAPIEEPERAEGHAAAAAAPLPTGPLTDEASGSHVELLERRIAKLTALLAQAEANLRRIAAAKSIDPGVASIYRGVQGLSEEDAALDLKRNLMQRIFQANLEFLRAAEQVTQQRS